MGNARLERGHRLLEVQSAPCHSRDDKEFPGSLLKVRKGAGEEIPLVQGKEQWLCFAGQPSVYRERRNLL